MIRGGSASVQALASLGLMLAACSTASPTPGSQAPSEAASASPMASASASQAASAAPSEEVSGWRQLAGEDGPDAREDHTWTLTPDGATAYLFGGRTTDNTPLGDLWAYDLASDTWQAVVGPQGQAPPARFGHNAVWAEGIGLVVFAGQAGTTFFNDLWAFNPAGNTWRQLPAGGAVPVARYGSCAAIGPDARLWISHGFTSEGSRFADTAAYDFTAGSWSDETPAGDRPVERCLHGCWWNDDGQLTLYGGQTTGILALGDLWTLTPGPRPGTNAWAEVTPEGELPADRNLYATAPLDPSLQLVFGGQTHEGALLNDAWVVVSDGAVEPFEVAGTPPPARSAAELIYDAERSRFLLFGGRDADAALGDLWELRLPG